ncbi:MAG: thiamine diphosphokinase [Lachnospiraceae bacterium]|nr:thiamine diphosphokinase [Lachnospiraceae bacterium]
MKKCFIVGAGDFFGLDIMPEIDDYVIAADAGYDNLVKVGVSPDLIIGDFDSRNGKIPAGDNVITLPVMKDDTDIGAAFKEGWSRGYREFHIFGSMGGARFAHTVANVQLASNIAEMGGRAFLYGKDEITTAIHNGSISFTADQKGFISIFSMSDVSSGVTIRGLKYTLEDSELKNTFALGVSNEFIGEDAEISVRDGILLIIRQKC